MREKSKLDFIFTNFLQNKTAGFFQKQPFIKTRKAMPARIPLYFLLLNTR